MTFDEGDAEPSSRALSGRLKFTVRRHKLTRYSVPLRQVAAEEDSDVIYLNSDQYAGAHLRPGVLRANLKSHTCHELRANLKLPSTRLASHLRAWHLFEVAFVLELTEETTHSPLGCLQGGPPTTTRGSYPTISVWELAPEKDGFCLSVHLSDSLVPVFTKPHSCTSIDLSGP